LGKEAKKPAIPTKTVVGARMYKPIFFHVDSGGLGVVVVIVVGGVTVLLMVVV
jgi:tryptophan-rich sensory protein